MTCFGAGGSETPRVSGLSVVISSIVRPMTLSAAMKPMMRSKDDT